MPKSLTFPETQTTHELPRVSSPVACHLCGTDNWKPIRKEQDWYRIDSPARYALERCARCGLVAQNPMPSDTELSAAYAIQYELFRPAWDTPGWPVWKILRKITVARRLRRLQHHGRGRELLEVGCGAGDFLLAARDKGWNVRGLEYSQSMVEALRSRFSLDVSTDSISRGQWPDGSLDAVAFWDVLEHLPDPLEALKISAAALREGGVVLLSIPSGRGAAEGQHFGSYWAALDLPRHLFFFDRPVLAALCDRAGLQLIEYKCALIDTLWCYVMSSLRSAQRHRSPFRRWAALAGWMTRLAVTLPYLALKARQGKGPQVNATAVKKSSNQATANSHSAFRASRYDIPTRDKLPVVQQWMGYEGNGLGLDIGCGTGYSTAQVFGKHPVVCVDVHAPNLLYYRRQLEQLPGAHAALCVVARATALPFKSESFSHVLCSEVLEHLEDDDTAAGEMARVLQREGKAVITVPYSGLGFEGFLQLCGIKTVHDMPGPERHVRPGYDEISLGRLLGKHGLSLARSTYYLRFFTKLVTDAVSLAHLIYQRVVHRRKSWNWSEAAAAESGFAFRLYAAIFPLLWAVTRLDGLLKHRRGFGFIAEAKK